MMILSGLTASPPEPPRNYQSTPTFPGAGSLYFRPLEHADTRFSQFHFNIQSQLNSQQPLLNIQSQLNSQQPLLNVQSQINSQQPEEHKGLSQQQIKVVEPAPSWDKQNPQCLPCEAKLKSATDTQTTGSDQGGQDVDGGGGGGGSRSGGGGSDSNSLGSRSGCGAGAGAGSGGRTSAAAAAAAACSEEPERKTITIRTPERCEGAKLDLLLTPKVSERSLTLGAETDDNSKGREGGDTNERKSEKKDCAKDRARDIQRLSKASCEVTGRRRSSLERSTTSPGSCGCHIPGDDVIGRNSFAGRRTPSSFTTTGRQRSCDVTGSGYVTARDGGVRSHLSMRNSRSNHFTQGEQGSCVTSWRRRSGYGTRLGGGRWGRGGGRECGACDGVTSHPAMTRKPSYVVFVQAPSGPAELTTSAEESGSQEARKTRVSFDLTPSYDQQDSGLPQTETPNQDTLTTLSRAAMLLDEGSRREEEDIEVGEQFLE